MGIDNCLYCEKCLEDVCIARNGHVLMEMENLATLSSFLNRHAEHYLIFAADDNWVRVKDSKDYIPKDIEIWNRGYDPRVNFQTVTALQKIRDLASIHSSDLAREISLICEDVWKEEKK